MRYWLAMASIPFFLQAHDTIGYVEIGTNEAYFPYPATITEADQNSTFNSSINNKSLSTKKTDKPPSHESPNSLYLIFFLPNHYEEKINELIKEKSLTIEIKQNIKDTSLFILTPTSLDQSLNEKNKMIKYKALIPSAPSSLQPGEFFYIHINEV